MVRSKDDIHKAHDMLSAIILGDVPSPWGLPIPPEIIAAQDILCWVLNHEHNRQFADNLKAAEGFLADQGYERKRVDEAFLGEGE